MQTCIFEQENWRNLLLKSKSYCKIVIMGLRGLCLEIDISVKRMFFHVCQMGLKNLNVFNTVFAAKYKAQKCWFTDWKQDAKRNGGCFSWIDVKKIFWFTKNIEIWNLEMLYLHELENKTSYNKKKARKPWEGLYWAAEHWDVTSDAE